MSLFRCVKNSEAAKYLIHLTKPYDNSITEEKILLLDLNMTDSIYDLPSKLVLGTGLNFIWKNRSLKKGTSYYQIRSESGVFVTKVKVKKS